MIQITNLMVDGRVDWNYLINYILLPAGQWLAMVITTILVPLLIKRFTENKISGVSSRIANRDKELAKELAELKDQILILRGKVPEKREE